MTNTTTAIATKPSERMMEFVPFGAADKIKLTIEIVQNLIATKTKSGRTCSPQQAAKFMMLCQAQRLNPFAGDAFLVGYDGKDGNPNFSLIVAHQALLKRAETCQGFEGMESGIIIKVDPSPECPTGIIEREGDFALPEEQVVGGWARVYRTGRKPTYRRLAITQRRPNYPSQFWEGAKANEQIVKCSEADALRSTFPTLLGGLYTEGERIIDITSERVSTELPANRLVAVTSESSQGQEQPAQTEPEQEQPKMATKANGTESEVAQVEKFITEAGYTFTHLQRAATESGIIAGADSLGGFADITTADAKRLLRAKTGLLAQLAAVKAAESGAQ